MTSKRQIFSESQIAQYFDKDTLVKMSGRSSSDFHRVAVKELVDNAIDAAESAGIDPEIEVDIIENDGALIAMVTDNGSGITPEVLDELLDYSTFTSDKALYRTPSRGQQGNALKTLFALPFATGFSNTHPIVTSSGWHHTIKAGLDEAGLPMVSRDSEPHEDGDGTKIAVPVGFGYRHRGMHSRGDEIKDLVRGYHLFNPHLKVSFNEFSRASTQGQIGRAGRLRKSPSDGPGLPQVHGARPVDHPLVR